MESRKAGYSSLVSNGSIFIWRSDAEIASVRLPDAHALIHTAIVAENETDMSITLPPPGESAGVCFGVTMLETVSNKVTVVKSFYDPLFSDVILALAGDYVVVYSTGLRYIVLTTNT